MSATANEPKQDIHAAIAVWSTLFLQHPHNLAFQNGVTILYKRLAAENIDGAIDGLKGLLVGPTNQDFVKYQLASLLKTPEKYENLSAFWIDLLKTYPDNGSIQDCLVKSWECIGVEATMDEWTPLLEGNTSLQNRLAGAFDRLDNKHSAAGLERLRQLCPTNQSILYSLVTVLGKGEDIDEAILVWTKLVDSDPENFSFQTRLETACKERSIESAISCWEGLLKRHPTIISIQKKLVAACDLATPESAKGLFDKASGTRSR